MGRTLTERAYAASLAVEWRETGAEVLNKVGTLYEGPGWPDFWIGSPHFQGWVEVKRDKDGKISQEQRAKLRNLRRCGVPAFVLWMPSRRVTDERRRPLHLKLPTGLEGLKDLGRLQG